MNVEDMLVGRKEGRKKGRKEGRKEGRKKLEFNTF